MRLATLLAAVTALLAAEPALACRGMFGHRYVILETPPRKLPPGAVLLRVQVPREALFKNGRYAPSAVARITGASNKRLVERRIDINPQTFSSCGHWRESEQATHVVGFVTGRGSRLTLVPVAYRSKQYRTPAEDRSEGITGPSPLLRP